MKLVGWHPDDGRPIYHPHIQKQGNRWILYLAEHVTINKGTSSSPEYVGPRGNGTTILDVTDPTKPKLLAHLSGASGVGGNTNPNPDQSPLSEARSMRVCERNGKFYMIRQMPAAGRPAHRMIATAQLHLAVGMLIAGLTEGSVDCSRGSGCRPYDQTSCGSATRAARTAWTTTATG